MLNARSSCSPSLGKVGMRPQPLQGQTVTSGVQKGMGSRGPQPPALNTDGHQVSDTSLLRATSRQLQWGHVSLPTISGVWLMSAVRAVASTTMWATVMGSSGPAAAGTTYQCGTRDRGDSSGGLQSSVGLVSMGLGLCPCTMAGMGALSFANRTTTLNPTPSLAQGVSPLALMSLVTEEHRAPSALGEDSRRK